jgi:serine/threonine-protein kinase RsbW
MDNGQEKSFPARTTDLYKIRSYVREEAERASLPANVVQDLVLAVSEACANSALHSDSDELKIRLSIDEERVEIVVQDGGVFSRRIPMPEMGVRGGRGIPLMMALMDEFAIREGNEREPGTVVRLVKYAA